jgi:uncharacterized protein YecT (DUF1311 family)
MKLWMTMIVSLLTVLAAIAVAAQQDGTAPVAQDSGQVAQSKDSADTVCNAANTQIEINQCYGDAYQKADKDLNRLYSRVTKKQNAAGLARLQLAQRAWLKYRDAHCAAAAAIYRGGSIQPSIRAGCLSRITRTRIDELQHVYATSP